MDLIADANHLLARSREHEQRLWRLVAAINAMVDKAAGTRKRLVRISGALADVWSSGPEGAVLSLETLWYQLIAARKCALLCGYSSGVCQGEGFNMICDRHSHVVPSHATSRGAL